MTPYAQSSSTQARIERKLEIIRRALQINDPTNEEVVMQSLQIEMQAAPTLADKLAVATWYETWYVTGGES